MRLSLFALIILAGGVVGKEPVLEPDGGVMAKLSSLKPGHAITLGKIKVIGEFNETARKFNLDRTGPMGRDFTIKMVWMPDRKRSLFLGANHGVPHRLNDVWEFDLPSLTWSMLYAPDLPRDYMGMGKDHSDVEFKNGLLITKRGGPAVIAHTWWGFTYDPVEKAALFMNTWVTDRKKCVRELGGDPALLDDGPPLWAFFPATRTWKPRQVPKPAPAPIFGGLLEYIPELRGSIWHANNWQMHGTWLYDNSSNRFRDLKSNDSAARFEKEAPAPEQVGYYDPARKLVIVHRHFDTHHFDPVKNEWKCVLRGDKESGKVPYGHDAYAPMYRDAATGHGLLVELRTNSIWAYNPDSVTWVKLTPMGDAMPKGNKRLVCVDPELKVLLVLDGTTAWAYRHQASASSER